MLKLLIPLLLGMCLVTAGCTNSAQEPRYRSSPLSNLPFVYKMTVQQGNIVTEEMVDRLEPGMTKSQVRFLLGTPMMQSMFHLNRWDYTYTIRRGHQDTDVTRLVLFFEEDELVKVQGDINPDPQRAAARDPAEMIVSVPDWEDNRGIIARSLDKIGVEVAD
jgi:outer membrane protein assembly factor BamE